MKLLILFSLYLSSVFAQEGVKLKDVTMSYGDSAFTSGLNIATTFSLKPNRDLELVGNSERFYTTVNFKTASNKLSLDATAGAFKKLPWVGPRVVYTPVKQVMAMYWSGVSAGRVEAIRAEPKSFFQQLSFYVYPIEGVSLGYTAIKMDVYKATMLPEVAYKFKLMKDLKMGVSATYDTVAKKPLFCVFLSYSPPQK
ncbi:MAG: hypothetical protein WC657_01185 [Candidatus Paceibacterota bacterium]|jgi:hypothetical protein